MAADVLRLPPGVPVVVAPDEPGPVRRAAQDLQRDLEWVLGAPSPQLEQVPDNEETVVIVVTSRPAELPAFGPPRVSGGEAHAISVAGRRVLLEGADARGAIYAIYSFSDHFLDVPPWWFWAGWKPRVRDVVEVPVQTDLRWQSPKVKWRAWFPNDTDLLSPWIQQDYATRWNLVVETMLRLKLNLIDVGEFSDRSIGKTRIPRDRGLAITTSHAAPLGAYLGDWERFWTDGTRKGPAPPLTLDNVQSLESFWEHHVRLAQRERLEMLWTIGFRGAGDKGFFKTFVDAPADDAARARIVQQMMQRQIAVLKRVTGQADPPMRTILYDECSDYVAAGLLEVPDEPTLIWNFTAARRDHFPAADLRQYRATKQRPLGLYFNIQFTNSGSHLADGEGPWKLEKNHRFALQAGNGLALSIVNSGNTREFPLSLQAHAAMMWDPDAYASDRFVDEFCRRYWGPRHGPRVAQLFRDSFNAYWQQRRPSLPDFPRQFIFQDLRVSRAIRELLLAARIGYDPENLLGDRGTGFYRITAADSDASSVLDAVIIGSERSAERFARVAEQCDELAPELDAQGRAFFDQTLLRQSAFMAAASRCLAASAHALESVHNQAKYQQWIRRAQGDAQAMRDALEAHDEGVFENWYAPETVFGLAEIEAMIDRRIRGQAKPPRTQATGKPRGTGS